MDEQLKSNLTSSKHWIRLLYMLLFALALYVASVVMGVLVIVQFLFALITGNNNLQLRRFGDALSIYIFDTLQFLIYNSESKPFPFADWPESNAEDELDREPKTESSDTAEAPAEKAKAAPKRKASPRKKATAKKATKETTKNQTAEVDAIEADTAKANTTPTDSAANNDVDTTENKSND